MHKYSYLHVHIQMQLNVVPHTLQINITLIMYQNNRSMKIVNRRQITEIEHPTYVARESTFNSVSEISCV